ncbi:MAG: radical SAM family heme chaperone HemW [Lentisphaerae bacterium]|nr:radical SAM family heme chaperone HemW [Lentisphaerota bacterium]
MLSVRPWQNLYIHVPFCLRKCDYCAFYSEADASALMRPWLDRIGEGLKPLTGLPLHTVYLGGGTPTVLKPELLEELLSMIMNLDSGASEISIECNPESLTPEKAAILGRYVSRVSLGVQSFDPALRRAIGRCGDPEKIVPAFEMLTENGLTNLSCDLIYGLPGQSVEDWERDLTLALQLPVRHLSAYALTVEEGTLLAGRYRNDPACDIRTAEMEKMTRRILKNAGMKQYEISNYARPGYECVHNQNIWHGETYLGLGPAACSFDGRDRYTQVSSIREWLAGAEPETDHIPDDTRRAEMLMMGLRTVRGWTAGEFERAAGISPEKLRPAQIASLRRKKMMKLGSMALTRRGLDFWNDAALELL